MTNKKFSNEILQDYFTSLTNIPKNRFHPLVWIVGNPKIGRGVIVGGFTEIQAKNAKVIIGNNCDIASFVAINAADSHKKCIGISKKISRGNIKLGSNIFVGSHSVISGNIKIGHHSVIAAGTILVGNHDIPPYSLISGNPAKVRKGYFKDKKSK